MHRVVAGVGTQPMRSTVSAPIRMALKKADLGRPDGMTAATGEQLGALDAEEKPLMAWATIVSMVRQ